MAEPLPVTGIGIIRRSGLELDLSRPGHQQDVPKVGMPRSAEVRVTESDDRAVSVLVARTVLIRSRLVFPFDVVGNHISVW